MNKEGALYEWVIQATWSLEECAHLIHQLNPEMDAIELSDTSNHPVCRTFYWLKKEFEKGRLHHISGDLHAPRFSPGTLMRHLEEKGHYVSQRIRNFYDAAHGHQGKSDQISNSRPVYIQAAELIWKEHPHWSATRVSEELGNLPNYFTKNSLSAVSVDTIRKWLKGKGPNAGKGGRPKSIKISDDDPLDITWLDKQLSNK